MGDRVNSDFPPFSRVFVVCSKTHKEDDVKSAFQLYGAVEDVWMVKDRMTKENKGICYVKFDKASAAALAIESLDGTTVGGELKPIKAMIASSKNSPIKTDYNDENARTRLFVVCPKEYTEDDLKLKFEQFGDYDYCNIIRDKQTGESKGFGYVKFIKASTAALAMENCDKSLKAIIAEPKSVKFARDALRDAIRDVPGVLGVPGAPPPRYPPSPPHSIMDLFLAQSYEPGISNRLYVILSPALSQEQLFKLFDLFPGMEFCDLKRHHLTGESRGFAYVTYSSLQMAMYVREKLNGFEYPLGSKLVVKYAEDPPGMHYGPPSPTAEPFYHHSGQHSPVRSPVRSPMRSLSPVRPIATRQRRHSFSTDFDGRVFFICNPQPPPEHTLQDIFSRFGILTDVWIVRGKNYGYAKFTTRSSAEAAITALHGMEVFGVKLKVMLADPPPDDAIRNKRPRM